MKELALFAFTMLLGALGAYRASRIEDWRADPESAPHHAGRGAQKTPEGDRDV